MEARGTSQVEELIRLAVRAGAYRVAARTFTDAAETFEKAAEVNSGRVAALADRIANPRRGNAVDVRIGAK